MTPHKAQFKGSNAKCTFLKPENIVEGTIYAFTYNPSTQPYRDGIGPNPIKFWWDNIVDEFNEYKYCELMLYPEISSMGRLHFHGVIIILDTAKFYYYTVPEMVKNASIEMDTVKDELVWYEYCTKQEVFIQQFLHSETMPLTVQYNPNSSKHYKVIGERWKPEINS